MNEGVWFLGLLLLVFTGGLAILWWSIRVVIDTWSRKNRRSLAVRLLTLPVAFAIVAGVGGIITGFFGAFGAVGGESVDPSQKARILAEGISEAMNCIAWGILIWIPSMAVLLVVLKTAGPREEAQGPSDIKRAGES